MPSANLPVVYDYLDYRAFLRAYYDAKKAKDRGFSFRVFSRLAGVKASNHLKLVMDGKARPARSHGAPLRAGDRACTATRWSTSAISLASTRPSAPSERSALLSTRLTGFRGYRNVQRLELEHAAYHANWYIPAIRELAARPRLRRRPGVDRAQLDPPISKVEASAR